MRRKNKSKSIHHRQLRDRPALTPLGRELLDSASGGECTTTTMTGADGKQYDVMVCEGCVLIV